MRELCSERQCVPPDALHIEIKQPLMSQSQDIHMHAK